MKITLKDCEIQTDRLFIRTPKMEDVERSWKYVTDPKLTEFMTWEAYKKNEKSKYKKRLEDRIKNFNKEDMYFFHMDTFLKIQYHKKLLKNLAFVFLLSRKNMFLKMENGMIIKYMKCLKANAPSSNALLSKKKSRNDGRPDKYINAGFRNFTYL